MTSVDKLLATMAEPSEGGKIILTVDEDLRIITIPSIAITIGAEGDKNVNRLWFQMSRYYRGTDLSGFSPRVNYTNANGASYYYECGEPEVTDDTITFSWLIADKAAEARGTVEFSLCLQKYSMDTLLQEFNTTTATLTCLRSIHEWSAENDKPEGKNSLAVLNEAKLGKVVLG